MMRWLLVIVCALAFSGWLRADDLPGLKEPLRTVVQKYLIVQQKLAADTFDGVTAAATDMKAAVAAAPPQTFTDDFAQAIDDLVVAKNLHGARLAFHPLSSQLIAVLAMDKVQTGSLHAVFCPMIKARWVQTDGHTVHNPYYGAAMPDCGEIQTQF